MRTELAWPWFRVMPSVTTAFCGGWKISLLINNPNVSIWSKRSKCSWASASNQDDALQCSFHVAVPVYHCPRNPSAQETGRKKSPQDTLSQQKLPTSFSKLLSSSAAQEEQLQLFLEYKTCSPSLRRHRMPRSGSVALNRTETSSATQSSGAAGLCNTIVPSHFSAQSWSSWKTFDTCLQ